MLRLSTSFLLIPIFAFAVSTSVTAHDQDWGVITPDDRTLGAPASYPEADAFVIFDQGFVVAELSGLEFKRHVRIKILAESGIKKVTPVVIECKEYDDIGKVKATIHKPDGRSLEVGKKELLEFKDKETRSRTILFSSLEPGDIFEYSYQIRYYGGVDKLGAEKYFLFSQAVSYSWVEGRENRLIEWDEDLYKNITNIPAWYFDHPVYTMLSEFVVKLGAEIDYTCVPANLPREKQLPVSRRGSGLIDRVYKYHTWALENIAPPEPEPFMPRPNDYRPSLHFELFSTPGENRVIVAVPSDKQWVYTGRNFQGYLNMYVKKPRSFRKKSRSVIKDLESDHDQVLRLYEHVRDEYKADLDGYRLKPVQKNMREFYKKKTGAPFESNILLVQMLNAVGIDAWLVLISTRDEVSFRRTARFNHMLAYADLDAGGIYVDASAKSCPYGALPPRCRVAEGVLVDHDDSRLVRILARDPESHRLDSVFVAISPDGIADASVTSTLGGYMAMELEECIAGGDAAHWDDSSLFPALGFGRFDDLTWRLGDAGKYVVGARLSADQITTSGDTLRLSPPIMPLFLANPFVAVTRLQLIDFTYPFTYECAIVFNSDAVLDLSLLPPEMSFSTDGASFVRLVDVDRQRATITTRIALDRSDFAVSEYVRLREFFRRVAEACNEPLMVR